MKIALQTKPPYIQRPPSAGLPRQATCNDGDRAASPVPTSKASAYRLPHPAFVRQALKSLMRRHGKRRVHRRQPGRPHQARKVMIVHDHHTTRPQNRSPAREIRQHRVMIMPAPIWITFGRIPSGRPQSIHCPRPAVAAARGSAAPGPRCWPGTSWTSLDSQTSTANPGVALGPPNALNCRAPYRPRTRSPRFPSAPWSRPCGWWTRPSTHRAPARSTAAPATACQPDTRGGSPSPAQRHTVRPKSRQRVSGRRTADRPAG